MGKFRIVFSGSGGQGVITAAIILSEAAALHEDINAVQSQTYGPEARGGATRSDVIISDTPIYFPKVTQPNILVCLTQLSYNKYASIIRPGGILISDSRYVKIKKKIDAKQLELPIYNSVMNEIANPITYNICMLGYVIKTIQIIKPESVIKALKNRMPAKFIKMNERAFHLGLQLVNENQMAP